MQKNLTEGKLYKHNQERSSMKRSLDDLIGKKGTLRDIDGKKREVFFPKEGVLKLLGLNFPIYSHEPRLTRTGRGPIADRLRQIYGSVEIVKNKVYKSRNLASAENIE